jgi:TP901 family phage tail tape measure protein
VTIKTILEEIVTVFTADSRQHDKVLDHIVKSTLEAQVKIERSVERIATAASRSAQRVRSAIIRTTTPGMQPMQFASMYGGALPFAVHAAKAMSPRFYNQHMPFASFASPMTPFAGGRRGGGGMLGGLGGMMGGMLRGAGGLFAPIISGAKDAIQGTGQFFHFFNRNIRRMWYDVRMMGHGFRYYIVTPFVAGITASLYAFGKFDDAIHYAMALFGDGSSKMEKQLQDTIMGISKQARTSPRQLAEQLKVLASANYTAEAAMKALGTTERFYVASGMDDAAKSTQLLIGVQSALGLKVDDAAQNAKNMVRVGNLLVKANQLAQVSVEDFAEALTNKAAAGLRMVGKDAEEGLAILAAYASQNVKGAAAGTQFSIVLRDIQRASLKNPKQWEALIGKRPVFDVGGNLQNLGDIVGRLSDRFATMTDEQRAAATVILGFNDRSSNAIKMLMGMGKEIREFEKELRGAGNAMEEVYQERMKSFVSMMKMTFNWIHATGIEIGKLLEPQMRALGAAVRYVLGWWNGLSDTTKQIIIRTGIAIMALAGIIAVVVSVGAAAAAIVSAWEILVAVFTSVAGAVAGIVVVLIALDYALTGGKGIATAVHYIGVGFQMWWSYVKMVYNTISLLARVIVQDISQLPKLLENLGYNFGVSVGAMVRIFSAFSGWLTKKLSRVFTIDFMIAVASGTAAAATYFFGFLGWLAKGMYAAMRGQLSGVVGFGTGFTEQIKEMQKDWEKAFAEEDILKSVNDILGETKSKFRGLTDGMTGFNEPLKDMAKLLDDDIEKLRHVFDAVSGIKEKTDNPFRIVFESKGIEGVIADSAAAFDAVRTHLETLSPDMQDPTVYGAYSKLMGGLPDFSMPLQAAEGPGGSELGETNTILREMLGELKDQNKGRTRENNFKLVPMKVN